MLLRRAALRTLNHLPSSIHRREQTALRRNFIRYCATAPGGKQNDNVQKNNLPAEEKGVVEDDDKPKKKSWLWGAGAFVVYKFKWILGGLKFLKLAKFGSLFLSMGAYALIFGWPWAVMFITLMFISELGHVAARVFYNLPVYAANFVPLLGLISQNIVDVDPWKNAVIALAGPATCVLCLMPLTAYAVHTGSQFWLSLALAAFNLQLLTMIPFGAFSGGRVCVVVHPYLLVFGFLVLLTGLLTLPLSPLLWIIFILGLYPTYQAITRTGPYAIKSNLTIGWRLAMGGMYFGVLSIIGLFLIGIMANLRSPKRVAQEMGQDADGTLIQMSGDDEIEDDGFETWEQMKRRGQAHAQKMETEFKGMRV
eukprot:TRINITY_DN112602_c0_g1_i1.p1 TRINITY_DN112602_c0_g1~~TRINITY_DN112602_c0_g1_i1.p1  ORF type:complete len:366 (-),score=38.81 TRINITY_DN112602_c0_g1_i1:482-1579(-)